VEGGGLLAKYRDGYPKVPPKRVPDAHGAERLEALGGLWPDRGKGQRRQGV
jgi:hypothetical protein